MTHHYYMQLVDNEYQFHDDNKLTLKSKTCFLYLQNVTHIDCVHICVLVYVSE